MYKISTIRPLKTTILPLCYRNICKTEIVSSCPSFHQLLNKDFISVKKYTYLENLRFQSSLPSAKLSVLEKIRKRTLDVIGKKTRIARSGCLAYEKCADTIDYDSLFRFFNLPDTFQSWFVCVQLHVWIVILATISEENGRDFRNSLIESMWNDVEIRLSRLAVMKSSKKKQYLNDLVSQFQAALISYDEGILGDDTTLAAAAWRTVFSFQLVEPEMLENIVIYIRKQLSHIDGTNTEQIIFHGNITFLSLNSIYSNIENK